MLALLTFTPHGDHLLGRGHGPLRIRWHDSIVNLLYHTLSQDNSNVWLEERIWGATIQRPGDIYHPDFSDGHPAYFDVSVRNTLQPGNHNRASTDAGAAAIAGDMEKDSSMLGLLRRLGAVSFHSSLKRRESGLLSWMPVGLEIHNNNNTVNYNTL